MAETILYATPPMVIGKHEWRAVVQPSGPVDDPDEFEAELIAFTRDRIAHFKCPRSVVLIDELPRLPTGKISRRLLPPEVRH